MAIIHGRFVEGRVSGGRNLMCWLNKYSIITRSVIRKWLVVPRPLSIQLIELVRIMYLICANIHFRAIGNVDLLW